MKTVLLVVGGMALGAFGAIFVLWLMLLRAWNRT